MRFRIRFRKRISNIQLYISLVEPSDFLQYFVRHFCLFFSVVFQFCENFVSPSLSAPRFTPFPTKMLVTPIFEICEAKMKYVMYLGFPFLHLKTKLSDNFVWFNYKTWSEKWIIYWQGNGTSLFRKILRCFQYR